MICSLNEIGATLRKAAVGAGFEVGLAESIAGAAVWLCAHGLDGVGAVVAAAGTAGDDEVRVQHDDGVLTISSGSVGIYGPSVFELLDTGAIDRVVIESPQVPLLMIGFAGAGARSAECGYTLTDAQGSVTAATAVAWTGSTSLAVDGQIEIVRSQGDTATGAKARRRVGGVEVDESDWARALELAHNTYVPATEESRLHGAGAGLTDTD